MKQADNEHRMPEGEKRKALVHIFKGVGASWPSYGGIRKAEDC